MIFIKSQLFFCILNPHDTELLRKYNFFLKFTGCRKDFLDSMKQLKDVSGMDVNAIYTEQIMFMYLNLLCQLGF